MEDSLDNSLHTTRFSTVSPFFISEALKGASFAHPLNVAQALPQSGVFSFHRRQSLGDREVFAVVAAINAITSDPQQPVQSSFECEDLRFIEPRGKHAVRGC